MKPAMYDWADYYLKNMKQQIDIPSDLLLVILIFISGLMYQKLLFPQLSSGLMVNIFADILSVYRKSERGSD